MSLKSLLFALPISIKNVFDFLLGVNSISSGSSILFVLLSLKYIVKNKWYLMSLILLTPLIIIDPISSRLLLSISIFFIFFYLISNQNEYLSIQLFYVILIVSFLIVIGIFIPTYYTEYGHKYKFIFNDPNNFGPYASSYLSILMYFYFKHTQKIQKYLLLFLILGVYLAITLIKGRLYGSIATIEMLFFILYFYKHSQLSSLKLFRSFITIFALILLFWFFQLGVLNKFYNHFNLERFNIQTESFSESIQPRADEITSITGRDNLWNAFSEHINNQNISSMLYGSTYQQYKPISLKYSPDSTHSYVENSYFVTILFGGFVSLLIIITLQIYLIMLLIKHKAKLTTIFTLFYFIVFFFDDSFIYPISIFHQFLSIYTLFQIEVNYAK